MSKSGKNVLLAASLLFLYAESQCNDSAKNESEHTNTVNNAEKIDEPNKKEIYNDILSLNSNAEIEEKLESKNEKEVLEEVLEESIKQERKALVVADVSAPSYDRVIPIKGWNRYSGDSAKSVKQWVRWWKYLGMKQPVVMSWIDGLVLRVYPGNEVFRSLFVNGIYDPNNVVIVNSMLSKGSVFIDVGANMGYFSLLASNVVGKSGSIIAIEPSSRDYARLVDNVKINGLSDIILTYRFAVSDNKGSAKLGVACEERSALNTLGSEFSFKGVERVVTEDVRTISIDELVSTFKLARVDFLKLDIEGSELKALEGSINTIEKFRPAIMLGVNENALKANGADHKEIQQMLKKIRYRAYRVIESPTFALELITDLEKARREKVVFCLHESVVPPALPQPENKSFIDSVKDFFLR